MRIRSGALASLVVLALASAACAPQDGADRQEQDLELWEPQLVENCERVEAFLSDTTTDDFLMPDRGDTVEIDLALNGEGRLEADPPRVALHRGQTVVWRSEDLRWTLRFVGDVSPLEAAAGKSGEAAKRVDGQSGAGTGFADTVRIGETVKCGIYHYVVAAHDTATDRIHVLDPPIPISN